jgi:hypothetical protein
MEPQMIIETSANRFYQVWETNEAGLDHVWFGLPIKQVGGRWVLKASARREHPEIVRKAATRIVQQAA